MKRRMLSPPHNLFQNNTERKEWQQKEAIGAKMPLEELFAYEGSETA